MTPQELRKAEAAYQAAFRRSEKLREGRNAVVWAAVDAGMSQTQIADAMGLTRGRVGQIVSSRRLA